MTHHTPTVLPLAFLSAAQLKDLVTLETRQYLHHLPANERYAMELFRRALAERDDAAWTALYDLYFPLVLSWVCQHSAMRFLGQESGPRLVHDGFAKFSLAPLPDKFPHFSRLSAILQYLKLCVHSVIADEVRTLQARPHETTLECLEQEPTVDNLAEEVIATCTAQELWQAIQRFLFNDQERTAIYLLYILDMKPREISRQFYMLFPTSNEVYRVRCNVVERLRRNERLQTMARQTFPRFSPAAAQPRHE